MPNTIKMLWPYPTKDTNPWFDAFEDMVNAVEASAYASREDRNIILSGAGDVSFTAGSGVLTWSSEIVVYSPISAYRLSIPVGNVTLADGQRFYVDVTRSPTGNASLVAIVGNQVPNSNTALLIALRDGSSIYFRNGARVLDGQSGALFAGGGVVHVSVIRIASSESHDSVTPLVCGGISFDPTDFDKPGYAKSLKFSAIAANGDVGMTTNVQLYNVTDGDLIATLDFTSTTPAKDEVVLVQGSSAGQVDALDKIYEVRISLSAPSGGPTETIELYGAEITVTSTPL